MIAVLTAIHRARPGIGNLFNLAAVSGYPATLERVGCKVRRQALLPEASETGLRHIENRTHPLTFSN
jgi:hypothetical protein